jgi:hypothetical protein
MSKRNKWRGFAVAAVAAAWLAVPGAVQPASAVLASGQFSFSGNDIWDINANTFGVVGSPTISTATGDFLGLIGTTLTFNQCTVGTPCTYTNSLSPGPAPSLLTGLLFSGSLGLTYTISQSAYAENTQPPAFLNDLTLLAIGTLTFGAFDPTPGVFALTTQGGGDGTTTVTFSATTVAIPGPVVGAGLPGLVLACGGLLALARRRRQQVAA